MALHEPFPRPLVAVEGEAEIPYAASVALPHAELDRAVLHVALLERAEAAHPHCVEQIVVDYVRPQELPGLLVHLLRLLDRMLRGREVGELRRDLVAFAGMARERVAGDALRFPAAVGGRGVEVVYAVLERVVDLRVHLIAVDGGARSAVVGVGVAAVNGRQAHHPEAEQRHLLAVRVAAQGHRRGCLRLDQSPEKFAASRSAR